MNRSKFKNAMKMIIFMVIVVMLLNVLSQIFIPGQKTSMAKYNGELKHFDLFYEEPCNSLDAVFLGSSHVFCGISPMEMWNTYGIAGYDCTSSGQSAYKSYRFLLDIFKYQKPKVVVFDLLSLFKDESVDEISNRSALNYMRFSLNFLTTAHHSLNRKKGETIESYIFPVLRYHSRWEELSQVDFNIQKQHDCAKGFDMRYGKKCMVKLTEDTFSFLKEQPTDKSADIVKESAGYICDIVELCRKNGAQLLFIKTPVSDYTHEKGNAMQKFADECGVRLIDYNRKWDDLGLDYKVDFLDTIHLNLNGAKKLTDSLGKTLVNDFGMPDHRGETEYSSWDKDYSIYQAELAALELQDCIELPGYLKLLENQDYVLLYAGNISHVDGSVKEKLELLPLEQEGIQYGVVDLGDKKGRGHYAGNGKMRYDIGDVRCEISAEGSYMIRLLGENVVQGEDGFYLAVFDKELNMVADSIKISNGQILRE